MAKTFFQKIMVMVRTTFSCTFASVNSHHTCIFFWRMFFMAKMKQYVLRNNFGNRYSTINTFVRLQYCIGPNASVLLKILMAVNQF